MRQIIKAIKDSVITHFTLVLILIVFGSLLLAYPANCPMVVIQFLGANWIVAGIERFTVLKEKLKNN